MIDYQNFPILYGILNKAVFWWKERYRFILQVIFILGLIYLILPGPSKIEDFPPLYPSTKSKLEGDTIQNPNITAYFSDFRRYYITDFYRQKFANLHWFGWLLQPWKLNHPPEYAYQYIRDQQESTFLEEYYYPLRESFFTNGYEPLTENTIFGKRRNFLGDHIIYKEWENSPEYFFDSKTTIRFYPNNIFARILVYLGIWAAVFAIYHLAKKALKEN